METSQETVVRMEVEKTAGSGGTFKACFFRSLCPRFG